MTAQKPLPHIVSSEWVDCAGSGYDKQGEYRYYPGIKIDWYNGEETTACSPVGDSAWGWIPEIKQTLWEWAGNYSHLPKKNGGSGLVELIEAEMRKYPQAEFLRR